MKLSDTLLPLFLLTIYHPFLTTSSCPSLNPPQSRADTNYRLPTNIQPLKYEIYLSPNLEESTLSGNVTIHLKVLEATDRVVLHLRSINVTESTVELVDASENPISGVHFEWEATTELFTVIAGDELVEGDTYELKMEYEGLLHGDNGGFYRGKYVDEDGKEKFFAATQFESTNARRAFPCMDEPALKSSFVVHLIRPATYSSISNGALVDSTDLEDGTIMDHFEETVEMSTYLVAFVVSDFDFIQDGTHKVYARREMIKQGWANNSLESEVELTKILEDFLGVEYAMTKMDQIAIPDDYFAAGAMENWGLITYKEYYLLYLEDRTPTMELQSGVSTIAHELAHQWFGNLVTLSWWEYLWLNEGFATYFQWFAMGELHPTWRAMEQFVIRAIQYAMGPDATDASQPMNYATEYPGGGPPSFVAYQKSASVIRMFEHFLTSEVFKKGLNLYLNERKFDSATPSHLYDALQRTLDSSEQKGLLGDLTVSSILTTWDSQAGYPLVTLTRNYTNGEAYLYQEKFLTTYPAPDLSTTLWTIPINYAFGSNDNTSQIDFSTTSAEIWMTARNLTLDLPTTDGWVILNKQVTGYYRVNYDEENWNRLIEFLDSENFEKIPAVNRAQLIDDAFNLAKADKLSYEVPLALSGYLKRETDYLPWYSFFNAIDFLNTEILSEEEHEYFKNYFMDLIQNLYDHLGVEEKSSDSHTDKLNRVTVAKWMCSFGDETCRKAAATALDSWKNEDKNIATNLQSAFFCGAIAYGGTEEWEFLLAKYESTPTTETYFRNRIVAGLGCTEDETLLKRYLDEATSVDGKIEAKHRSAVFSAVYGSGKKGLDFVIDYVDENYEKIAEIGSLSSVLNGVAALVTKTSQLDKLKSLVESHGNTYKDAVETAEKNVQWVEDHMPSVTNWLADKYKSGSTVITVNCFIVVFSVIFVRRFI